LYERNTTLYLTIAVLLEVQEITNGITVNEIQRPKEEPENPYLIMDFWHFAIISTLMVVFFPWSLLFCVIVYGLEETKLICLALMHDALKTFLAILSVILSLLFFVGIFIYGF